MRQRFCEECGIEIVPELCEPGLYMAVNLGVWGNRVLCIPCFEDKQAQAAAKRKANSDAVRKERAAR